MSGYLSYRINELSSVTVGEWIGIKSTLHAIDNRDFVCGECLNKYKGRQDADMMLSKIREVKGCFGLKPAPIHNIDREIFFRSCIGNYFSRSAVQWLEVHSRFDEGVMPFEGALLDQPSKLIEVMNLIGSHKRARMIEMQKQDSARSARGR